MKTVGYRSHFQQCLILITHPHRSIKVVLKLEQIFFLFFIRRYVNLFFEHIFGGKKSFKILVDVFLEVVKICGVLTTGAL